MGKIADDELRTNKINEINQQVFSLSLNLEQLQTMAVLDSMVGLEFQTEAINNIVTDVIIEVKALADAKNIHIASNLQKDLPKIPLDKDKVFLALLNLVNNAIQFTRADGHIALERI